MCLSQNSMLGVSFVTIRSVIQMLELPADIETYRQSKVTPESEVKTKKKTKGRLEV